MRNHKFFGSIFFCFIIKILSINAVINDEIEATKFIADASERYYKLYNEIAQETYSSTDDEDFDVIFKKLETVKKIASGLVEISQEASGFDLNKIQNADVKKALQNLHHAGDLFVLGEDYFSLVLINLAALAELSTDKDIEPYLGGANMPNNDDSALAYYPDIQKIFQHSDDAAELKYYWETWRNKNLVWSSINFYSIVEAFQKAANILEIPVLQFWYRYYNNKNFLKEMEVVMKELKEPYKQLHAFIRRELHQKYGSDVISENGPIPDHLYEQVLEQAWTPGSVIESYYPHKELPPYDSFVKDFEASKLIDEAESFYKSLGFNGLDENVRKERIREHDETENVGDCKADIFDITPQIYMKYCQKVNFRKLMQAHGYMSRVHYAIEKKNLPAYYFNSYELEYPVGEAIILSASTPRHLNARGWANDFNFTNKTLQNRLFRMGIHTLLGIPLYFVHTKVMNDLLDGVVEMDSVNKHFWKLMEEYAGVEPPIDREEDAIDFPYKFYVDIEDAYQTKKFVSEILGYQFYRAFCKKSGHTGALSTCDFYGNLAVGNELKSLMSLGSSKPWHEVIAKVLPGKAELSADALLEYYEPLFNWLKTKNNESKVKIGWKPTKKVVI